MKSSPFPKPAPDFDHPLEMLRACHERILSQSDTLIKLAAHLRHTGADQAAQEAAQQVIRYFTTAAVHHHQDEETDLFPLLRRISPQTHTLLSNLENEHRQMEALWAGLLPKLKALADITDLDAFAQQVAHFRKVYQTHIDLENQHLFAHAEQNLTPTQVHELGHKMAARRRIIS